MNSSRAILAAALAVSLAFVAGCNTGPKIVRVSGTVTRNGEPVPFLFLSFEPLDGRPSWGISDKDGKYSLHYARGKEGARVGTHKVFVSYKPQDAAEEFGSTPSKAPKDMDAITAKYGRAGTDPLTIEIAKAESNLEIKLD